MKKFYEGVVRHRRIILVIFILAALVSPIMKMMVAVNYDIHDYLPPESPSTISLEEMKKEYSGGITNAEVMIRGVNIPDALKYKKQLKEIEGISEVRWLDDVVDVRIPLDFLDSKRVEKYYKNRAALFDVTIEDNKRVSAVANIRAMKKEIAVAGAAVSTADATTDSVREIGLISLISVLFVLFVLIMTTQSWVQPPVVLFGLGVAIIINAGSNLLFGEISFVTNAAGNILQLAVSLDYSIFLLHRFEEHLKEFDNHEDAMVDALYRSTTSILSSGLTTLIGFLALLNMRFGIGPDLGVALAKGIVISLITVFVFMPALILTTYRWMEKRRHRSFMPDFQKFGRLILKIMLPCVVIFVLAVVPAFVASNSNSFYYGAEHILGKGTRVGDDKAKIREQFGMKDTYVLMVPKGNNAAERQLSKEILKMHEVEDVISYVDSVGAEIPPDFVDVDLVSKLISSKTSRIIISCNLPVDSQRTFDFVAKLRRAAQSYYGSSYFLAGEGVSTCDLKDTVTQDMLKVNLIAVLAVFGILVLLMRSIILPVLLVTGIETAIWINLAVPEVTGTTIFYIAYLITSSIQLGATVDYAILFTDRYKEFRGRYERKEAIVSTVRASTVSIMTSASAMMAVGFLMEHITNHRLLAQLGMLLGRGTLCSLVIVLFVLPGLLYIFDKLVMRGANRESLILRIAAGSLGRLRNTEV